MMYNLIKNLLKLSNHFTQKGFVAKLFELELLNFARRIIPDCTNQNISKQTLQAQSRFLTLLLSLMGEVSISDEVVNWFQHTLIPYFLVTCYATQHPALSVHWLVRHTLHIWHLLFFWPYCSCPNTQLTPIMAPAHPYATGVAVYPTLFF